MLVERKKESSNIFLIFSVFFFVWYPSPLVSVQNAGNTAWPFNLSKNQSAKVILKYAMLLLK